MRGQHPGISQPLPRQQSGYDDMQLLQQQLMYKQLQELQRQQQIQLGHEQKQQNSLNHISALSRQAPANQLPTLVNGVPLNDASNCSWQNEFTGSDPKASGNSQMSLVGNMNLAHGGSPTMRGLMISHDQGQVLRSMGFAPQQTDPSFYGMPISNTRTNHISQFQGMSQDFADIMAKADVDQAQKLSMESASYNSFQNNQNLYSNLSGLQHGILASKQDLQGKKIFGHTAGDILNSNVGGNFQQMNTVARASEGQELNIGHDQSNWTGTLQEKEAQPSGTSHVSVGLDPTEQKILFSSDDDINWDASFGRSIMGMGGMQGNQLEGSDLFNSFPSIQSGSWSALMQSAVAEVSSGDVGMQDEWSGLTFQKAESSTGNHTATLNDSVKQQTAWFHNNLPNATSLPSRPAPFENGEQPTSVLHSAEKTHFSPQNMEGPWGQQQNMASYTSNSRPQDKGNGWNINGSHSSNVEASFKVPGTENSTQHDRVNDSMKTVHTDRDHIVNMWNSDGNQVVASSPSMVGLESSKSGICFPQMRTAAAVNSNFSKESHDINQHGFYQHEIDYGKHVLDSSLNPQENENMRNNQQMLNRSPQMWESPVSNSVKVSGEIYDRKKEHGSQRELSNESYISSHSHPDHSSDSVGGARDNLSLSGPNSHSFPSGSQQIHGQVGHEVLTQRFHYHPIGNSVSGNELKGSQKQVAYAQGLGQMVARGFKGPDQRYVQQTVTNNPLDVEMSHANYLQSNAKGIADMHAEGNNHRPEYKLSASFEESAVMFPQSNQPGQTGQNMLELLHKVDQSREDDSDATGSGFSDRNTVSQRNETILSEGLTAHPQHHQTSSAFHGFGLRLALSSQRPSSSNSDLSSHISSGTVNNLNSTHHDSEVGDQKKTWSGSAVPVQTYNWDLHKKFVSRQVTKEASESNMQAGNDSMAGKAGDLSYARNQLQQQQISSGGGHTAINHPANTSLKAQYNRETYNPHSSLQQKNGTHDGSVANSQPSSLGISGRNPPFRLVSPPETHPTVVSQSYQVNSQGQSQPLTADSSIKRNSGQQLHTSDTGQVSQSSLTSGMSQQGGISGTSHNVWTNISTQRLSNSLSHKAPPALVQSTNSGKLDASSWILQKANDQDQRNGGSMQSNFGSFSGNPPKFSYAKERPGKVGLKQQVALGKADNTFETTTAPQGQEFVPNQASDGNSVLPNSSSVYLHQQEKHGKGTSDNHNLQIDQSTAMNAPPYSLLQQVQAMKAFDTNPNNRAGKRLKGTEIGLDSQQLTGKPPKFYGSNTVGKGPADDLSAVVHHGSFPTDSRMLSFSSEGTEQQNANKPQVVGREMSQDLGTSRQPVSQNYPHSISITPNSFPSGGRAEHQHVQINPQMAPSWFEQYGNLRNGSVPAMFGGLGGSSQNNIKMAAEHYFMPKVSESISTHSVEERKSDAATDVSDQLPSLQELSSGVPEAEVTRPKKRKSATSELLPWHREIMVGSDRLQNIRMAERDWAQATNRLVEKVENQADFSDDGHVMPRSRRRLILTTQLMQQLLPSIPAAMLSEPASTGYENVTYLIAKLSLGDACGLVSCLRKDACGHSDSENRISGKSKASERLGDQFFLKLMENFVGRARKLETDSNRLEKRASILDIKVECQDLEKFAIINRFAKFHGRSQTDGLESSTTSETSRNMFAHRYVTALSMPGNVPEEVVCLSL